MLGRLGLGVVDVMADCGVGALVFGLSLGLRVVVVGLRVVVVGLRVVVVL